MQKRFKNFKLRVFKPLIIWFEHKTKTIFNIFFLLFYSGWNTTKNNFLKKKVQKVNLNANKSYIFLQKHIRSFQSTTGEVLWFGFTML